MLIRRYVGSVPVRVSLKSSRSTKTAAVPILFYICVKMRWTIYSRIKWSKLSINTQITLACRLRCKKRFGSKKKRSKVKSQNRVSMWKRVSGKRLTQPAPCGHVIKMKWLKSSTSSFIRISAMILKRHWHGRITALKAVPNIRSCCMYRVKLLRISLPVKPKRGLSSM